MLFSYQINVFFTFSLKPRSSQNYDESPIRLRQTK